MRYFPVVALVSASFVVAQTASETRTLELYLALQGDWTGTLEYRGYSEAATSEKRVKLPTWLNVSRADADGSLRFEYVYDDGPGKVVRERQVVRFNVAENSYVSGSEGKEQIKDEVRYSVRVFKN